MALAHKNRWIFRDICVRSAIFPSTGGAAHGVEARDGPITPRLFTVHLGRLMLRGEDTSGHSHSF
jgi:hypothetical protein